MSKRNGSGKGFKVTPLGNTSGTSPPKKRNGNKTGIKVVSVKCVQVSDSAKRLQTILGLLAGKTNGHKDIFELKKGEEDNGQEKSRAA